MSRKSRWSLAVLACLTCWLVAGYTAAADPDGVSRPRERGRGRRAAPSGKNEPAVKSAFQEALDRASAATVRVLADGEEVALGAVVAPDGYLVTKASVLAGKIACRFRDGSEREALIVGENAEHDLALLRVEAKNLATVPWREGGPPPAGSLVATTTPGRQPVAIGVLSSGPRTISGPRGPLRRGWLGVELGAGEAGLGVKNVTPGSPAAKAGLRPGDEIRQINRIAMKSADHIIETIGSHPPKAAIRLSVHRGDDDIELPATLARRPPASGPEDQWGGGPFSERRSGFPAVLPHDTPLHPADCGGPLVDSDGRAIGINIARALRVVTYALPADVVRQVAGELTSAPTRRSR